MRAPTAALAAVLVVAVPLSGCLQGLLEDPPAGPGDRAVEFLDDGTYTRLVVEVDWVAGQRPSASALDLLERRARQHLSKPGGVQVVASDEFPATGGRYTPEDLHDLEDRHRDRRKRGSTAVMYALFLDGSSAGDSEDGRVLGVAYGPSSLAVYKESVRRAADGGGAVLISATDIERSVLVHEAGHLWGLVDNGIEMCRDHADEDHPRHSANPDSVMYWAVGTDAVQNLIRRRDSAPPTTFDGDDVCDMRRAGGA